MPGRPTNGDNQDAIFLQRNDPFLKAVPILS
ncbi:hypothetical protein IWX65_003534 [Arthrobacter sp. CAN_A214]